MGDRAFLVDIGGVLLMDDLSEIVTAWTPRLHRSEATFLAALFGESDEGVLVGQVEETQWWGVVRARLDMAEATLAELRRDLASAGHWSEELVSYLRDRRGRTKTAAVANAWPYVRPRLRQDGLADLFDELVLSCEVGCAKPDPRIYRLTLDRLGVAPGDALFVDDVAENVEAAESIGMQSHLHRDTADTTERIGRFVDHPLP
jgi:putative hydrolase of the HAD superfamily